MGDVFEGEILRLTPNRIATRLLQAWGAASLCLIPLLLLDRLPDDLAIWLALGWFGGTFALLPVLKRLVRAPKTSLVRLRIDDAGIHVDGELLVERRSIRSGAMYAASDDALRVVFRHRRTPASSIGPPLIVFLPMNASDGRAILVAAGVAPDQQIFRATSFRSQRGWPAAAGIAVYASLSAVVLNVPALVFRCVKTPMLSMIPALVAMAVAVGLHVLLARTTVTVAADGIEIKRALRKRFISVDEVHHVDADPKSITIVLVNEERIRLTRTSSVEPEGRFGVSDIEMDRCLLVDRIEEVIRLHRLRDRGTRAAGILARGERSFETWVRSLRRFGTGTTDYRTSAVRVEELRRVVTDTTATTDVRVGAALALRFAEGDGARQHIRDAARNTAVRELCEIFEELSKDMTDERLQGRLARLG